MIMTNRHKQILEAVELLRQDGQVSCTRKDVLSLLGKEDNAINYSIAFKELEESGALRKSKDKDGRNIQYILIDKVDMFEDLDEIFDSLMKAVDMINVRVNRFKEVKEDRDFKIQRLESDMQFYRGKCGEYRDKVTKLQEKINGMKWG